MTIPDFETWREELISTGRIAQDGDPAEVWEQSKAQVARYLDLLDMARGVYEKRVFEALLDSMQVEDDYEVYETTVGVLFSFPPEQFGLYLTEFLPCFLERDPERAGDLLSLMVNNAKSSDRNIVEFKCALRNADASSKETLFGFIKLQEKPGGWLDNKPGWYDDAFRT
jgi:hypothetical protein